MNRNDQPETTMMFRPLRSQHLLRFVTLLVALCALVVLPSCQSGGGRSASKSRNVTILTAEDKARSETLVVQAEEQRATGDEESALSLLEEAVEINPMLIQAHLSMADIYRERGDHEFAIRKYRNATEVNPRNYDAQYYLGLCLQLTNRLGEAIRAYRRALSIDPQSHEANLNVATAYLQGDQPIEALPFAIRAAELQPEHGPTHINLAAVYSALNQHDKATTEYRKASEFMDLPANVMLNFADSLRALKRYPEMANALEAFLRVERTPGGFERLGYAYFKMRRFGDSRQAYQSAIELNPTYYPALNGLAVNLLNEYIQSGHARLGAKQNAVRLLRQSLRIEENQPRILNLLSRYGR